jgi:hypothetical protein
VPIPVRGGFNGSRMPSVSTPGSRPPPAASRQEGVSNAFHAPPDPLVLRGAGTLYDQARLALQDLDTIPPQVLGPQAATALGRARRAASILSLCGSTRS